MEISTQSGCSDFVAKRCASYNVLPQLVSSPRIQPRTFHLFQPSTSFPFLRDFGPFLASFPILTAPTERDSVPVCKSHVAIVLSTQCSGLLAFNHRGPIILLWLVASQVCHEIENAAK